MVWGAKQETIDKNPELVKVMMDIHRKATEYAMSNESAKVEMAVQKLGQTRKSIELASPNVELTWKIDDEFIKRAKAYAQLMHEKKQIRELPNFDKFVTTKFMPTAVASREVSRMRGRCSDASPQRTARSPVERSRSRAAAADRAAVPTGAAPSRPGAATPHGRDRAREAQAACCPSACRACCSASASRSRWSMLWHQLVVMTGTRLVPTPYQVGLMMYDFAFGGIHDDAFSGTILTHLLASMQRVYGGFALAVAARRAARAPDRQGEGDPAARRSDALAAAADSGDGVAAAVDDLLRAGAALGDLSRVPRRVLPDRAQHDLRRALGRSEALRGGRDARLRRLAHVPPGRAAGGDAQHLQRAAARARLRVDTDRRRRDDRRARRAWARSSWTGARSRAPISSSPA